MSPKRRVSAVTTGILSVTSREADCLELLGDGMSVAQVAASLAIAQSTLEKHLASARRKIGAKTTRQATLAFLAHKRLSQVNEEEHLDKIVCGSRLRVDLGSLASSIEQCETFDQAFDLLSIAIAGLGYRSAIVGVVAEPFGSISNGAKLLASSFSQELMSLYAKAGGAAADPVANLIAVKRQSLLIDQRVLASSHCDRMPALAKDMSQSLVDAGASNIIVVPAYDEGTDAPYCLTVEVEDNRASEVKQHWDPVVAELQSLAVVFWLSIQRSNLLASRSGLKVRHRQLLSYAARGFSVVEAAEQMDNSVRMIEKLLHQSRTILGAKTTASAVYRATVYGALRKGHRNEW